MAAAGLLVAIMDSSTPNQAAAAPATTTTTATTPRFLQRLCSADEHRRRRASSSASTASKQQQAQRKATTEFLDTSRRRDTSLSSESAVNVVPSLTYASSAASASSSEPHSIRTEETESEGTIAVRRNVSSFLYGYATDIESSGYSSGDSRSTSPASKSAFASPAFPGSYDLSAYSSPTSYHSSHFLSHHPKSGSGYSQQASTQFGLQPLSLGPPSLSLPSTPLASTSTALTSAVSDVYATSTDDDVFVPPPSSPSLSDTIQPPDNFAMVYSAVYRSSFPSKKHYSFLKSLKLKTVLTLVPDEYPEDNKKFFEDEGITFHQIGMPGNKEPFVTIPDEKIRQALAIVLDKRNHPLLIHCNKGKHRTGCLVGCLRKMQCWSNTATFDEYRKFSYPKSRAMDQLFIELFQPDWGMIDVQHLPEWCLGEDGGGSPGILSPTKSK